MKKRLSAALALAFALNAGAAVWAANPFSDVPAKHWSYDAVAKLAAAGIVDGYGDSTFKGEKTMTRYEMATAVAKAMAKEDKANAEQKAAIDKLAAEYSSELDNLGVRVSNLEKKVDNVTFSGKARFRYDTEKVTGSQASTSNSKSYLDLYLNAQINKDWKATAEIESAKQNTTGNEASAYNNTTKIYLTGPIGGTTATLGKFGLFTQYGLVADSKMVGAQVAFGNQVKTTVRVGHLPTAAENLGKYPGSNVLTMAATDSSIAPSYRGIELNYNTSKVTNTDITLHQIAYSGQQINIVEAGFKTQFHPNWNLSTSYAKSNLSDTLQNRAYFSQLTYKAANAKKEGTYDIFLNYRNIGKGAVIDPTYDYDANRKGWAVGFDYIPAQNVKLTTFYLKGKQLDAQKDDNVFRAQVEMYF